MAAKTFEEFWEIVAVPHSRQGNDYVFAKELTRLTWAAATKAAEEKFTANNSTKSETISPCHNCPGEPLIDERDVNECEGCPITEG